MNVSTDKTCNYCGRPFNRYSGQYKCASKHKFATPAEVIVDKVLDALSNRKGIGHILGDLDEDILYELEDELAEIVNTELRIFECQLRDDWMGEI